MSQPNVNQIASLAARAAAPAAKLKKATQEIEAIFVKDLVAAMRKTAKHQSLGSSLGGDMYQDMLDQALSESAAKSGNLGIAQTIFRQMAPQAIRAALRDMAVSAMSARSAPEPNKTLEPSRVESESKGRDGHPKSTLLDRDGRATSKP